MKTYCTLCLVFSISFFFGGCTTDYSKCKTQDERIIARYEKHIANGTFRRICIGVLTAGISESWYGKVRRSYHRLMSQREEMRKQQEEDAREWKRFRAEHIGWTRAKLLREFGTPDEETPDGEGGFIFLYEESNRRGRSYFSSSSHFSGHVNSMGDISGGGFSSGSGSWSDNVTVSQIWFVIDKKGKVADIRRKIKQEAGGRSVRHYR